MDMTILHSVVSCLACPECFAIDKLILEDLCTKKKGLASYLCIKCGACGYRRHFYSSKMIEADGCGMKSFDIHTRIWNESCWRWLQFIEKPLGAFKYAKTNDRKES